MFTNIVHTYGWRVIQWVNKVCDKLYVCLVISQIFEADLVRRNKIDDNELIVEGIS